MLDANIKAQLKTYMERLVAPIELVASLDDSAKSQEMRGLLEEIASVSDRISLLENGVDSRRPSFSIGLVNQPARIRFAGLPMGHEFTSLILALLQASGYAPKITDDQIEQIRGIEGPARFETYISLSCHNCPDVVQALNTMAALNPNIQHVMIDGALFQNEVETRQVMAVPTVYLNGEVFGNGRMAIEDILAKLDTGAGARDAAKLSQKAPYDVLVVGGGPAAA
ncbi:MAG: thioredoxin family protein, partial [Gammaproteobacteria bacterium]|nr:thioredoxin family protein [Gammaproteobacteria bacterium]